MKTNLTVNNILVGMLICAFMQVGIGGMFLVFTNMESEFGGYLAAIGFISMMIVIGMFLLYEMLEDTFENIKLRKEKKES